MAHSQDATDATPPSDEDRPQQDDTLHTAEMSSASTATGGNSPAERVFQVTELLEKILLQLDRPKYILPTKRINKTFFNTIEGSISLQRALWFRSSLRTPVKPIINPLLCGAKIPFVRCCLTMGDWIRVEMDTITFELKGESWEKMLVFQASEGMAKCLMVQPDEQTGRFFSSWRFELEGGITVKELLELGKNMALARVEL